MQPLRLVGRAVRANDHLPRHHSDEPAATRLETARSGH